MSNDDQTNVASLLGVSWSWNLQLSPEKVLVFHCTWLSKSKPRCQSMLLLVQNIHLKCPLSLEPWSKQFVQFPALTSHLRTRSTGSTGLTYHSRGGPNVTGSPGSWASSPWCCDGHPWLFQTTKLDNLIEVSQWQHAKQPKSQACILGSLELPFLFSLPLVSGFCSIQQRFSRFGSGSLDPYVPCWAGITMEPLATVPWIRKQNSKQQLMWLIISENWYI